MPLDLEDILNDVKWIPVPLGNLAFNIAYRPSGTSIQRQSELRRLMARLKREGEETEIDESEEMAKIVCETVADWDLTSRGQPVPLVIDVVKKLPSAVYDAIMAAITADRASEQAEKKVSSVTSGAGLPATVKSEPVLNGIPSSERRGTWA